MLLRKYLWQAKKAELSRNPVVSKGDEDNKAQPLTFEQVYVIGLVPGLGMGLSLVVFVVELFIRRCGRYKQKI